MNPLPPLPLVDGALLFDNSTLESLVCPHLYELHNLRGYELSVARAGRNFGACLHVGWRERRLRFGNNAVPPDGAAVINEAMAAFMADNPQPHDDFRSLEHAQRVMAAYNNHYRNEPWRIMLNDKGKPAVESSFMHELGKVSYAGKTYPLWYTGRVDLYIEDNQGEWGFDGKSAFMFGKGWTDAMAMDSGQLGYCWNFLKTYGRMPRGYIIDGVRIRRPKKGDEYSDVAPVDATDLQRLPFYITKENLDEWEVNTLKRVQSILYYHQDGYFPQNRKMCVTKYGCCDFYSVCSVTQGSRQAVLDSEMFIPNKWSPLNKEVGNEE